MKSHKALRGPSSRTETEDSLRKANKLAPIKKSGKEQYKIYSELDDEEDEDLNYKKRESVLDYFDDGEEDDQ